MKTNVQRITFTALMTALICVLAPISIPLPDPMPAITLGTFAIYISAYIIGPWYSSASVLIYILLGIVGLPIFSKGQAGLQVVVGPTGGYMLGYFFITLCTGLMVKRFEKKIYLHIIGMVVGMLACHTIGTIWLGVSMHLSTGAAIAAGFAPFMPGEAIKITASAAICYPVRKQLIRMIPSAVMSKS